jgi:hypothetical protein
MFTMFDPRVAACADMSLIYTGAQPQPGLGHADLFDVYSCAVAFTWLKEPKHDAPILGGLHNNEALKNSRAPCLSPRTRVQNVSESLAERGIIKTRGSPLGGPR